MMDLEMACSEGRSAMTRPVFLNRVVIENYKSIASCDVTLGPVTYLVGPNGAGKSNFLDAIRFVSDALNFGVDNALRSRGGGDSICHAASRKEGWFRIVLHFALPESGQQGVYSLRIGIPPKQQEPRRWAVLREIYRLPEVGYEHVPDPEWPESEALSLPRLTEGSPYRDLYLALSRMCFYQIRPHEIEDTETFDPARFLLSSGSNLASVLFRLGMPGESVRERINEYFRVILPGLVGVRVEPVLREQNGPATSQKVALLFEQQGPGRGANLFWPSQMSDGTLRVLGILTALLQATVEHDPRPSLVAIEEPEAQVHPAVLSVLRDAMNEASYSTQVLVTTQSPDLIDDKEVDVDSILAVSVDEEGTRIGPVDEAGRSVLRDQLFTPGELLRIGHLSPADDRREPPTPEPQPTASDPEGGA
jgi:predicted ATPase